MKTILYSSSIKIYENNILVEDIPFGNIHTQAFIDKKKRILAEGGKEMYGHYPDASLPSGAKCLVAPRSFQNEIASKIANPLIRCGIIKAPTGGGKTNAMVYGTILANKTTIIIVPTRDLVVQTKNRFAKIVGKEYADNHVGVLHAGKKQIGKPILVTTWHALQNKKTLKMVLDCGYNMLFVDETHRASAKVLSSIVSMFKSQKKFGFSASVYKKNEQLLSNIYDLVGQVIQDIDIEDLYRDGFVLRPKVTVAPLEFSAEIENGIFYYYHQIIREKFYFRKELINRMSSAPLYKEFFRNNNIGEMLSSPNEDMLRTLAIFARDEFEYNTKQKMRVVANASTIGFSFDVAENRSSAMTIEEIKNMRIGLAKKGIDAYKPRLEKIREYVFRSLSTDANRAMLLFNTKAAGDFMAHMLMEGGFNNVMVVNGDSDDKSVIVEDLSSGKYQDFIIVSTTQLLSEGNDIPILEDIYVCSPVYMPYGGIEKGQQITGRAARPSDNESKQPHLHFLDDILSNGYATVQKQRMYDIIDKEFNPIWDNTINKPLYESHSCDASETKNQLEFKF